MTDTAPLDRLLAERQADRLPSVAASVVRKGDIVWRNAIGSADYDEERDATPGTQYRIGSITKTFTAVAVMQLREQGRLELEDRLDAHLDVPAHRDLEDLTTAEVAAILGSSESTVRSQISTARVKIRNSRKGFAADVVGTSARKRTGQPVWRGT